VDLNSVLKCPTDPSSRQTLGLPQIHSPAPRDTTRRSYSGVRCCGWTQSCEEIRTSNYSTSQDTFIIGIAKRLHSDCRGVEDLPCTVATPLDAVRHYCGNSSSDRRLTVDTLQQHSQSAVFETRLFVEATEEPFLRRRRLY